jgi:flagellar assembly protein FliH
MSSSSKPARARVMRGAAALDVRRAPFEVDLTTASPLAGVDRAKVDQAMAEGFQAGFDRGRAEGYEAGVAAARIDVAAEFEMQMTGVRTALEALRSATADTVAARAIAFADVEDEVAAAAFAIAEAVLDREHAVAKTPGRDALARAMALAPVGDAVVRLHPDDVATLGKLQTGREIRVVADPTVERGGAVAEVGACTIDAQICSALERVRKALAK